MRSMFFCIATGICSFKVNNGNEKTMCEIYSQLIMASFIHRSGVFIVDFRQISYIVLVFPSLYLSTGIMKLIFMNWTILHDIQNRNWLFQTVEISNLVTIWPKMKSLTCMCIRE